MYLTVASLEARGSARGPREVIARPGQDVELLCTLTVTEGLAVQWRINHRYYGINALLNGLVDGYSAIVDNANMIVQNIMIDDSRNGSDYWCAILNGTDIVKRSESTFLYTASEYDNL